MWKRYLTGAMATLILLSGTPSFGGERVGGAQGACLDQLSYKVQPGKWIRVTAQDGGQHEGRFGSVDFAQSLLTLTPIEDTTAPVMTYEIHDIDRLQYREKGRVKPGYLILGTLAGAFLGASIGAATTEEDPEAWLDFSKLEAAITGGLVGGIAGLGAGIFISLETQSTRTINCR